MTIVRRAALIAWLVAVVTFPATVASSAETVVDGGATGGIAFDEVFESSPNAPDFPPSSFEHDFQLASHPGMVCEASVLRRSMTVDRERVDDSCHDVTLIVDCRARTALEMYHQSKTYAIVSFDATPDPQYAAATAQERRIRASVPKIDDVVVEDRQDLGSDRYRVVRRQTQTDHGAIGVLFSRETMTYAFEKTKLPELRCIDEAAPYLAQFRALHFYMPELSPNLDALRAREAGLAPDATTESGPELPQWRIVSSATGDHLQTQTRASTSTNYFKIESGHVRSIANDDPSFSIPSGYANVSR